MAHNLLGRQSVQLDTFGGTVTLADPTSLPEGASPRNQNCDFNVGSALTRQGLENPFTYQSGSQGPNGGDSATNVSTHGNPWSNPTNVLLNTGVYATVTLPDPTLDIVSVECYLNGSQFNILVIFASDTESVGTPYTFSGLTTFTDLNGQTLTSQPAFVIPSRGAIFAFGTSAFATTPDTGIATINGGTNISDAIDVEQFAFSVPSSSFPQGFVVNVTGYASGPCVLDVQMIKAGTAIGLSRSVTLNVGSPTTAVLGSINDLFGEAWTYADLNSTQFGVRLSVEATAGVTAFLGYTTIEPYFLPTQVNFDYVTTYEDDFGNIYNVALDADGDFWIEYVSSNPNVLVPLFSGAPANSFASSFTADSRQYMAISDLRQGNYPPQQIVGTNSAQAGWQDRVSQVGPGSAPSFTGTLSATNVANITNFSISSNIVTLTADNTFTAGEIVTINEMTTATYLNGLTTEVLGTGLSATQFEIAFTHGNVSSTPDTGTATPQYTYPIAAAPSGITQFPFWNQAQGYQSQLDDILWSAGPGQTNSGNVITVYYLQGNHGTPDANLIQAFQQQKFPVYVYISGTNLPAANGTQLVTSVGIGTPPGGAATRYYFTFNTTGDNYQNLGGGANAQAGQYQLTVATVTAVLPLPNVQTGDQITISGDPIPQWDQTWTIVNALNSGTYLISQTSMTSGVATYNWALAGATSTPPVVGQLVTVTGTLNGNGIFNVTDAVISNVTGSSSGTFEVAGFAAQSFGTQSEVGQASTSGTKFMIDPGPLTLGNSADDPIYGNSGGGYITLVGSTSVVVGTGTRRGTVFFITRNGYWTQPPNPATFTVNENTNYILVSNIPIGPPNVIARAIVFTEAGQNGQPGASYYVIPEPVSFVFNGNTYLSSSTFINDNVTTTAKFTFPDTVLLDAEEVDIQGNDLFNLGELGDSAWCVHFATRSVYGRVRNKIQNFVNLTFDGGYNPNPGGNILPLGWGLDAASNPAGSQPTLLNSPVFGNSYYIQNQTGSTQAQLGMIIQTAYQDWHNVAILSSQTPYSLRVTCRTPSSAVDGALVVDLTEYNAGSGYGKTWGAYTLNCSAMTSNMVTYEGTLLTSTTLNIPADLFLRVWASGLLNGGDIEIDRIEIFPTIAPTNLTGLVISYKDDLESFDQVTGGSDTSAVNAQPANGAFELHDTLYIVKESSLGYIKDAPNQEPSNWNRYAQVSNVAGACGINAYDFGKEWGVMACQNGLFLFNGGEPIPIQLEIPEMWEAINWPYAYTMCVRNNTAKSRILLSVPMVTPNPWCPDFEENTNPTTPNVIMLIDYSGIGTIEELMEAMPMHVSVMGGDLIARDLRRKWSLWSAPTPYMAICKRSELFSEMLFCNGVGSSKIYQLGSYQSGADDGVPFVSSYCTYGFISEKKAEANPMFGLANKRYAEYDFLLSGSGSINSGTLSITFFQNVLSAPYPFAVPGGVTLSDPAANDIFGPLNEYAQRLFVEVKTVGVGCYFNLSRLTLMGAADAWAPIPGN